MTKIQFLIKNKESLNLFVKLGIASCTILSYIEIYKFYNLLKDGTKMDKYQWTADNFNLQPRQIMKILKDLDSVYL